MRDAQSRWAQATWRQLLESRRRRNRSRRWAVAIGGLGIACAVTLLCLARCDVVRWPVFTIHAIEVSGNRAVAMAEILDLLGVRANDPWWKLDPSGIRARLVREPRIRDLALHYGWFHRLGVEIVERESVLSVLGGQTGELTGDGWLLPPSPAGDGDDLPVLRVPAGMLPVPGSRVGPRVTALAQLISDLQKKRPDLWRDLSEIDLSGDQAQAYLRSRRGVIVFSPGEHDELWDLLPGTLDDLDRRDRTDVVLDLRFPGQVVVHLPDAVRADSATAAGARGRI